jgi:ribonucleoside-diphosphate reductase alpha chain
MCEKKCKGKIPKEIKKALRLAILGLEAMPSMRCMMTAGPALERDEVAGFNCSYVAIDDIAAFDEMLYLLMCGCGVGYSVERQFISKLPQVAERLRPSPTVIKVEDSRIGWANSLRELISMLYQGRIPEWDVSAVRPSGARLKTFGGRSSGPGPLEDMFRYTVETFKTAAGRKLNSLECHDMCCKIADVVVVGGVRRSACISLSNPSDDRMRHAKSGNWHDLTPWRQLANNSACYTEKPGMDVFMREWIALFESKSGERGIFNRQAAKKIVERLGRRDHNFDFGCNPCSEIIMRSNQFCNLTEVVVRPDDTLETLKAKVRLAVIMGTMQSTLTDFRYLRDIWKKNTEEEALLGVSLTGIMDHLLLAGKKGKKELKELLNELRDYAIEVNIEWAEKIGVAPAAAITCVKPSGTVSQLVDCASGIHSRYSPFYIRTIRADKNDPLSQLMVDMGFPYEDDVTKPDHNWVFSFPVKAPEGSIVSDDMNAMEQLEMWKMYQVNWCEHKPSMTVYVKDYEWMEVGAWVYSNFDIISGITFLPYSGHTYKQAPYQEISEKEYLEWVEKMPKDVDWSKLKEYEKDDEYASKNAREPACAGGSCEIADIGN